LQFALAGLSLLSLDAPDPIAGIPGFKVVVSRLETA